MYYELLSCALLMLLLEQIGPGCYTPEPAVCMQPISQTLNCAPETSTVSVSVSRFAEFAGVIITALDSFLLLHAAHITDPEL